MCKPKLRRKGSQPIGGRQSALVSVASVRCLPKEGILRPLAGWKLPDGEPRRCKFGISSQGGHV